MRHVGRTAGLAVLVAGTLDLLSAFVFAGMAGKGPGAVMRGVAAGPFGDAMREGGAGAVATGFVVHYSIMTAMVAGFLLLAAQAPVLLRHPVLAGAGYGLLLYIVMYWMVLPLRWPAAFPRTGLWDVGNALFSHIVCVGIPMALVVAGRRRGGVAAAGV